jgi:hypothetical protein
VNKKRKEDLQSGLGELKEIERQKDYEGKHFVHNIYLCKISRISEFLELIELQKKADNAQQLVNKAIEQADKMKATVEEKMNQVKRKYGQA